ncbi:hypothetical protein [Clostridium folliculivorans]|uniref:hypothetical protein n=1 Tax=Clostridium folliculivorans TaxID=2886038 RepID=UPI0021C406AB|nr:hypothetical protein [Clostridium folliculivorans]GKU29275.1 hypothetical protein CFB3_13810 [Clostridium folliculivorans]
MKGWDYDINLEFDRFHNIKKWISNKTSNKLSYDCDVSKYAMDVYKNKYSFLNYGKIQIQFTNYERGREKYNPHFLKWEIYLDEYVPTKTKCKEANFYEKTFTGDTLNSFATPFNDFVDKFLTLINYESKPERFQNCDYPWLLKYFDIIFSDYNFSLVKYSENITIEFDKFASLTHTIGNQFPCPLYFNAKRSGIGNYEFPDLLLDAIYTYYNEDSDIKIKKIVQSHDKLYYTTNWLEAFNSWENFVKKNYFDLYLEKNKTPSKLWGNHVLERTELPQIGIEFLNYLKQVNYLIEKRGKQILGVN